MMIITIDSHVHNHDEDEDDGDNECSSDFKFQTQSYRRRRHLRSSLLTLFPPLRCDHCYFIIMISSWEVITITIWNCKKTSKLTWSYTVWLRVVTGDSKEEVIIFRVTHKQTHTSSYIVIIANKRKYGIRNKIIKRENKKRILPDGFVGWRLKSLTACP